MAFSDHRMMKESRIFLAKQEVLHIKGFNLFMTLQSPKKYVMEVIQMIRNLKVLKRYRYVMPFIYCIILVVFP